MRNPFAGTGLRRYTRAHLRHDRDAARAEVLRLEGDLRQADATVIGLRQRVHQLEANAVDVSVERQLRLLAEDRADESERRCLALKSRADNAVPPMRREVDADEQSTEPRGIGVRPLREALNPTSA